MKRLKRLIMVVMLMVVMFLATVPEVIAVPTSIPMTEAQILNQTIANLHLQITKLQQQIMLLQWKAEGIEVDINHPNITLNDYIIVDHLGRVWLQRGYLRRLPEFDLPEKLLICQIPTGRIQLVPLRPLIEALGYEIHWRNGQTGTISILSPITGLSVGEISRSQVVFGSNNRTYVPLNQIMFVIPKNLRQDIDFILDITGVLFIRIKTLG